MTTNTPTQKHIPDALTQMDRWVLWREEHRNGKATKVPCRVDGTRASSIDARTWTSYDQAVAALQERPDRFDGVGLVLGDGLAGIDLDHCRDPETGEIQPWARNIIDALNSYAEVSPSGTGVHILLCARLTREGNRRDHVELYDRNRYFTVTGNHVPDTPPTVENRQAELDALHRELFPETETDEPDAEAVPALADDDLLAKLFAAKNGEKAWRLWHGDTSGYASASEADSALCCLLAFYTRDPAQIDRLFRRSGLCRPKWTDRADYRDATIRRALATVTEHWTPPAQHTDDGDTDDGDGKPTQTEALLALAAERIADLFAEDADDTPYVQVQTDEGVATWAVRSSPLRAWLLREYRARHGGTPSTSATERCLLQLEAEALAPRRPRRHLHLRAARHGNDIIIDRGTPAWDAFCVRPDGWDILRHPPAIFRRHAHMAAYPDPVPGGNLRDLFDFVPVARDRDRLLLLAWVVVGLVPDIPRPLLLLTGPQGSGKSTVARLLRRLLDPSSAEVIHRHRDEGELLQLLAHHYCAPLDNLSFLSIDTSDLLCSAITGVASTKRRLYSDDEDVIYRLKRLVILNGITSVAQRPDLLDRTLRLNLARIDDPLPEDILLRRFDQRAPALLGALLDTLAATLRVRATLQPRGNFRMADFALYGRAAAEVLGFGEQAFIDAYQASVAARHEEAIEASPFATAVRELMADRPVWQGEPAQLLAECEDIAERKKLNIHAKSWPGSATWASRRLREAEVDLREVGITVAWARLPGGSRERIIRITTSAGTDPFAPDDPNSDPFSEGE